MARARGSRATLAGVAESAYGTTPASGFFQLPFISANLSKTQERLEDDTLGFGRDPLDGLLDAFNIAGDVVVPVDVEAFGFWLKAMMGDPATAGSDPYTHVFSSGGDSIAASEWSLDSLSLETGMPDVPAYFMHAGCKINSMAIGFERTGRPQATLNIMGQSETRDTSTNAGTPTEFTLERFGHFEGSISRNSTALGNVVSANITYSNNLDPAEVIAANGEIAGLDEAQTMLSGEITVRFDSTTLLDDADDGTPVALDMGFTKSAGKSLIFAAPRVFLTRPSVPIEGPAGILVTFPFIGAQDTDGSAMLTATLVNSETSY